MDKLQILRLGVIADSLRQIAPGIAAGGHTHRIGERAVVLHQPLQRLPRQVQPLERGIAMFQLGDDAQTLGVMVETALVLHHTLKRLLAGMAERRVSKIVGQRQGFDEVFVDHQRPRQRPRDLRHLQAVRQPGAVMIALVVDEHLRLVGEAAEGRTMHDAVAVALIGRAHDAIRLGHQTSAARTIGGVPRLDAAPLADTGMLHGFSKSRRFVSQS